MNIFKKILRSFFPSKEKSKQVIEKKELVSGEMNIPAIGDLVIVPEEIKVKTPVTSYEKPIEQKIEKPVVKPEKLIINSLNEAKSALSKEWNKRKKKNIYDNHTIARDYKKIKTLYDIINQFKAA